MNTDTHGVTQRLLRMRDVEAITGLARSTIYELQASGDFPKSIRIAPRAVAWPESDISAWVAEKIRGARSEAKA